MMERLYYSDSYLMRFPSRVSDIRLVSRKDGNALWQVTLEPSAFYPTSGGQPYDTGVLRAASRSGAVLEVPVLAVEEDEHGVVWHTVEKPLSAETEVEGEINWPRRLDHMQQHSGQHLLSAVFAKECNALTTSFHLGEQSSTIDLQTADLQAADQNSGAALTDRLKQIERLVNELIAEDRTVSIRTVSRQEAEALLAAGRLRKLPERDGDIRMIDIADYDLNACGGTHVRSTGQIGALLLRSTEKVRNGLRVEFVCGMRAVVAARRDFEILSNASAALTVGSSHVPEAVERLLAENKSAARERQKLREKLADREAAQLLSQLPSGNGLKVIKRVFDGAADSTIDADYCKLVASRIVAAATETLVLFASLPANRALAANVIMAGSKGLHFSCGDMLRSELAAMGLRGGGSREMAQGQLAAEFVAPLLDRLEAAAMEASSPQPSSLPAY